MGLSMEQRLAKAADRQRLIASFPPEVQRAILGRRWIITARAEQLPPRAEWRTWVMLAGRGGGKTRAGAEWLLQRWRDGKAGRAAVIGPTAADVRDVMIEGQSGILACARDDERPEYMPSIRRLTFPDGATWTTYSGDEPDRLRGPQHDAGWVDEPAAMPRAEAVRDNFLLGLRLGGDPRSVWTGTPKPIPVIRQFADDTKRPGRGVVITRWSTYDNLANLAPSFRDEILERYEGTRLGRQELHAEILEAAGTMFRRQWFTDHLCDQAPSPAGRLIFRCWDFAATAESEMAPDPDWTVGARVSFDRATRRYCIEDVRRVRAGPAHVEELLVNTATLDGRQVIQYLEQEPGSSGKAVVDHYIDVLRQVGIVGRPFRPTGPKPVRAQLLAGAAEQGRVDIVTGSWVAQVLDELEEFPDGKHDDVVDALAMAITALSEKRGRILV